MTCKYRINNICLLGNEILKEYNKNGEISCKNDAYKACSDCSCPHTVNYVVCSLVITHLIKTKQSYEQVSKELLPIIRGGKECILTGPGTELKKLLSYFNILPDKDSCDCEWHASQMNLWGSQKCLDNLSTIVQWMEDASKKTNWKWIFSKPIAATFIVLSCKLANGESWASVISKLKLISLCDK